MDVSICDLGRIVEENKRLKEENEILMKTVEQMNQTVNRLLNRFITMHPEENSGGVSHR